MTYEAMARRRTGGNVRSGLPAPSRRARFAAVGYLCVIGLLLSAATAQGQVLSGTYTGNGLDNRAITELGFQPDVVIVKGDTTQIGVIRTSTMVGDASKPMTGATALTADLIQSLDASGFTIGTDARVNSNTLSYYWVAFKAVAGEMKVSTYTGNGLLSQAITGVGFQPDLVFIMSAGANEAVLAIESVTTGRFDSFNFANSAGLGIVNSFDANGFTVGNDARVNASGVTYHYVAWNNVAGKFKADGYDGDGLDNRNITGVGFQPEYVLVKSRRAQHAVHHPAALGITVDDTLFFDAQASVVNRIQALQTDGFQVGSDVDVNESGRQLFYAAWVRNNPTAVKLASFAATRHAEGVLLQWRTGYEVNNLGFNVYRQKGDSRVKLTASPVAGSGLLIGHGQPLTSGQSYAWWDEEEIDGVVSYWLEDVDFDGTSTWHGPITPVKGKPRRKEEGKDEESISLKRLAETSSIARSASNLVLSRGDRKPGAEGVPRVLDLHQHGLVEQSNNRPAGTPSSGSARTAEEGRAGSAPPPVSQRTDRGTAAAPSDAAPKSPDHAQGGAGTASPVPALVPGPPPPAEGVVHQGAKAVDSGPAGAHRPADDAHAGASKAGDSHATGRRPAQHGRGRDPFRHAIETQRRIAAQPAVKMSVRKEGWYRVGQQQLLAAGLRSDVDPRTLQVFVDGVEQPIMVVGEADGRFDATDAIEFYGTGLVTAFTDTRIYWLIEGEEPGRRITTEDGRASGTATAQSFLFTVERKDRTIFFAALQNGEAENFFGALVFAGWLTEQSLTLTHVDPAPPGGAQLEVVLQGVTDAPDVTPDHRVGISLNGLEVGEVVFDGRDSGVASFPVSSAQVREGQNTVTLVARGGDSDVSLVDSIRLTYWHTYTADADRLRFTAEGEQQVTVAGFSNRSIHVVDVTNPAAVQEVRGVIASEGDGFSVTLRVPGSGARTLLALTDGAISSPAAVRPNQVSSWHKRNHAADYVMISHGDFVSGLEPLKSLREGQRRSVAVIDVEDVYDEFSFGAKTPWAIKEFLGQAKARWRTPPRFVLLVGNATTDPRDYLGLGEPDIMPTKLVSTELLETASDDWFADADGNGVPELAVGRLPARTAEQAIAMVRKIVEYEQASDGSWNKDVLLVADENDQETDFEAASTNLRPLVPADYAVHEVFRGQMGTSAARSELFARVNGGQLIVNYMGHGSVELWRGDLFTRADVGSLANGSRLPFVVTMNCLNGFFHGLFPEESLAEALVRAPAGGAVAVWASSGLTVPQAQAVMNRELLRLIFTGAYQTVGEAVAAAKAVVSDGDVRRSWIFFGDPAMQLKGVPRPSGGTVLSHASRESRSEPSGSSSSGLDSADSSSEAGSLSDDNAPSVRLVDFNGDGRDDVFLSDGSSGRWVAAFSERSEFRYRDGQWSPDWKLFPADFNGDHLFDLFLYDPRTGDWFQAINHGEASFTEHAGARIANGEVRIADFNGDRRDDVVIYDLATGAWSLGVSDGQGGFTFRDGNGPLGSVILAADFTGDRLADLLFYDGTTGRWVIGTNDGTGQFVPTPGRWAAGSLPYVANLNGDNRADVLLYDPASGRWTACLNERSGQFRYRSGVWSVHLRVGLADLSGDGRDDAVLYDPHTGSVLTAINMSAGEFAYFSEAWAPGGVVAVGDIDGDGRADIFLYNPTAGTWVRRVGGKRGRFEYSMGTWSAGWSFVGR